jgi:D-arabinose 1-dehydrogenase-like Zn-dependent alcohol dehydrogenase
MRAIRQRGLCLMLGRLNSSEVEMARMRAVQVKSANGPLEMVERDIPEPAARQVRIRVQVCGVCHSDSFTVQGAFPGIRYPRVPGHEVVGIVDAVGMDVPDWKAGQRVGVGWHGGHCGHCPSCRRGDFITCVNGQIPGISYDGGYADYMIAPFEALASVPAGLAAAEAAPLLCAGITTFNALRNSGARAGDLVAVLGIGGLGHLAVQFAAKMGAHTVAIARGLDKEPLARKLGAHRYIDSNTQDVAGELNKLGGARVVLATATNAKAMTSVIGGLAVDGKLIVVGASPEAIEASPLLLISARRSIQGWPSGTSIDSEDTMAFSALADIRPMIETMPLERASEAYDRMMRGDARFRMVLTTGA